MDPNKKWLIPDDYTSIPSLVTSPGDALSQQSSGMPFGTSFAPENYRCLCGSTGQQPCRCFLTQTEATQPTSEETSPAEMAAETLVIEKVDLAKEKQQRRKEQNRIAQERYRGKQQRLLDDALNKIDELSAEIRLLRAQKEHYRLMYEDLAAQMAELRTTSEKQGTIR